MGKLLASLYLTFFKIGLLGFGGGYAMISLIQKELEIRGWLTAKEFIDIIAIAEITPGPIAINSATFVGYKIANFSGALIATLGVVTPSFILVLILAYLFQQLKGFNFVNLVLKILGPVIIGLIIATAFIMGSSVLTDRTSILILIVIFILLLTRKVHPILLLLLSALAGIILYS
jgi:chromate transporter